MVEVAVFGAGGYLGNGFCSIASATFNLRRYQVYQPENYNYLDVKNEKALIRALSGVEVLVYCAGIVGEEQIQRNFIQSMDANVTNLYLLSKFCVKTGIKLVFSSSDAVNKITPGSTSHYAVQKKLAEVVIADAFSNSNVPFAILRFPKIVSMKNNLIRKWLRQAEETGLVTIHTNAAYDLIGCSVASRHLLKSVEAVRSLEGIQEIPPCVQNISPLEMWTTICSMYYPELREAKISLVDKSAKSNPSEFALQTKIDRKWIRADFVQVLAINL